MRTSIFIFLLLLCGLAEAQTPASLDPYQAVIPVTDQSSETRDQALKDALRVVVNRVSGDSNSAEAAAMIDDAPQLVQRYGFQRDETGALQLLAGFDRKAVDARLHALGLPVWGVYAAEAESFLVRIHGVRSKQDYLSTLQSLESLNGVEDLSVVSVAQDVLTLKVSAEGGRSRFKGAMLTVGGGLYAIAGQANELDYQIP